MSITVNDEIEVSLERAATGGAVGRLPDGRVVFVRHGLAGERVSIRITDDLSTFARGDAIKIIDSSEFRVDAPCAYAHPRGCGGCDLQHSSDVGQLQWKSSVLAEQMRRVAKVDIDVVVQPAPAGLEGWRTRLRCGVDHTGHLGLRQYRSHELVPINACYVSDPRFSEALTADWDGAVEVELRAIGDAKPFAVVELHDGTVVTSDLDGLIDETLRRSSVVVGANRFRVGATSFWQSHRDAPQILTDAVISASKPKKGERVVDLYAGVGLFSVPLAQAVGATGSVALVEMGSGAVADARHNVSDLSHVRVIAKKVTPKLVGEIVNAGDLVVLDPPRAGAGIEVMRALASRRPRRIVYVSCDAGTFARDVRVALDGGYQLKDLRAYDLFPMTEHVEIMGVLDEVV